jgi:hypothetical protein
MIITPDDQASKRLSDSKAQPPAGHDDVGAAALPHAPTDRVSAPASPVVLSLGRQRQRPSAHLQNQTDQLSRARQRARRHQRRVRHRPVPVHPPVHAPAARRTRHRSRSQQSVSGIETRLRERRDMAARVVVPRWQIAADDARADLEPRVDSGPSGASLSCASTRVILDAVVAHA